MTFRFLITSNSLKELKKCSILFKASKQQKELLQFNRNRYFSKFLNENSILSRQNQNVLFRKKDLCFNYRQQSNQASKPKLRAEKKSFSFLSWKSLVVCAIFGTGIYLVLIKLQREKEESIRRQRKQAIGKMAIGGPFELVDQNGVLRKNTDFLGQWLLIYFGFTHCPDICPEEMEKMVKVVNLIEKVKIKDTKLQPLFITVDPDRDDVKAVGNYVKGNKKQIEQVTKAYRVYYSAGPKDEDKDYIVDHTVIMYLIDPEGNFVDYYGQNKTAEEIATASAIHMSSFKYGQNNNDDTKKS